MTETEQKGKISGTYQTDRLTVDGLLGFIDMFEPFITKLEDIEKITIITHEDINGAFDFCKSITEGFGITFEFIDLINPSTSCRISKVI